jgi:hypothetical protein
MRGAMPCFTIRTLTSSLPASPFTSFKHSLFSFCSNYNNQIRNSMFITVLALSPEFDLLEWCQQHQNCLASMTIAWGSLIGCMMISAWRIPLPKLSTVTKMKAVHSHTEISSKKLFMSKLLLKPPDQNNEATWLDNVSLNSLISNFIKLIHHFSSCYMCRNRQMDAWMEQLHFAGL